MVLTLKQEQRFFIFPRTKRGGAASVRSRPPRDAGCRGRWDPELYGNVLGVENVSLPAGEAGVRGSRRRSSSGTPAGPLRAGLTAGARTHAGTRSTQSPGRPGRRASFTNPDRDGLRLLLGAPRTIPFLPQPAFESDAPRGSELDPPCAAACLRSAAGSPPAPDAPLPLWLGLRLLLTFPPPESSRLALPTSGPHRAAKRKCDA